ncbi:MAG TPA: hypothetical protein VGN24_08030 [Rhodanobacter sp.]|jgi:hypothetical protein|nr:hypothetical protein [Rhodanobacter sp.]
MSALAIMGGGLLAAAMAHAPSRKLMWTVAYLVLVVGATGAALGVGQALLPKRAPPVSTRLAEWVLFNLGYAGVIGGTLGPSRSLLWLETLFATSLALFVLATRGGRGGWPILAYRTLLVLLGGSAVVGPVPAMVRARP